MKNTIINALTNESIGSVEFKYTSKTTIKQIGQMLGNIFGS